MTATAFLAAVARGRIAADGAMGTALMAAGLPAGMAPEPWLLTDAGASAVEAVHAAHVAAGAGIVLTCTFGANPLRLAGGPAAGRTADVVRAAVAIARQAVAPGWWWQARWGRPAPSSPPTATSSRPPAATPSPRRPPPGRAGVDALWIETMADLAEARAAGSRELGWPRPACRSWPPSPSSAGGHSSAIGRRWPPRRSRSSAWRPSGPTAGRASRRCWTSFPGWPPARPACRWWQRRTPAAARRAGRLGVLPGDGRRRGGVRAAGAGPGGRDRRWLLRNDGGPRRRDRRGARRARPRRGRAGYSPGASRR